MSGRSHANPLAVAVRTLGTGMLLVGRTSEAQSHSMQHPPAGFVVYSRLMYGNPAAPNQLWGYDLFLQRVPAGKPIRLTDHRKAGDLGRDIESIATDSTGNYVAFRTSHPAGAVTRHPALLWIYSLRKRTYFRLVLPGSVDSFHWSPRGSTLAIELHSGTVHRTVLYALATGRVKTVIDRPNVGFWAWWGTGKGIVADQTESTRPPVLLSSRDGNLLFQWKLPTKTDVISVNPSPDGKHMLITTPDTLYDAPPGRPWKKLPVPFRNLPEAEFFWSPDSRKIAYNGISYAVENPPGATLLDKVHQVGIGDLNARRWNRPVFGWREGGADPPIYSLMGWSRNGYWLLLMQHGEKKGAPLFTFWARSIDNRTKVLLFATAVMLNSFDWHEPLPARRH